MVTYAPPPRTKVLLAVTPDILDRFERVLARHELVTVNSSAETMRALQDEFGMVILGVHFEELQMFSLLSDIRAHSK